MATEEPEVPKPDGATPSTSPELDLKKLHSLPSEQQDLLLLSFTADLAKYVDRLDSDAASASQASVKREVFKIIGLSSPLPTRTIRTNIGRSLGGVLEKGNRKILFESINELVAVVNTGKIDKDIHAKHAATHCLGMVFETAGESAIGLSGLACSSILKLLKSTHTGCRGSTFKALKRVIVGIKNSVDEAIARDIWKQARVAATDKSLFVQAAACVCLESLISETTYFDNSNDYERLQNAIWRAIDSSSVKVRHAAASALATSLAKSHSESPMKDDVPRLKKPKKAAKTQPNGDADDADIERPESPAISKPATQLSFSLSDILRQLSSHYCRPATSHRARASLALCYAKVFHHLGDTVVENGYAEIARHLFNDLLNHPSNTHNRYRLLTTRRYVRIVLEDVIGKEIMSEAGQLKAAKFLVNDILKDYPQALRERPEPSKQALIGCLSALTGLMHDLGSSTNAISDICRDGLLQVLQHPSYTVQIYAANCLQAFVLACPQQMLPSLTVCMNSVNRELGLLSGQRKAPRKCIGFAHGLAAVLSTSSERPLYGSVDVYAQLLSQATTLLKSSGSSDLRISSTQIQVAWILIGGLMRLGPNFVKMHLSQFLLLWKNALPKPLTKDNIAQRGLLELSFLAHVRDCALGSILAFLKFNSRILTADVSKRLAIMLENTVSFLQSLPQKKTQEEVASRLSPALQLYDYDIMVRRRVLQCFTNLLSSTSPSSQESILQTNLLPLAISAFADPENYAPSSLSASIASSAGNFDNLWNVGDNCGFGVSGLVSGFEVEPLSGEQQSSLRTQWLTEPGPETDVSRTLLSPLCGAREHDALLLYISEQSNSREPNPPSTQVVDAGIELFGVSLPLQTPAVQSSVLEQLSSFLSATSLQRDPARKAAITVNIATAFLAALKVAVNDTSFARGDLRSPKVEKKIQDFLRIFITNSDEYVRNIAAQALGRLCKSSGTNFTTSEVKHLIDLVVSDRDPNARSGCALALGCIHSQLGGMAAGYHLKSILGILMSLASDPHPSVHFWALDALSKVADSAGLTFSGFVSSTLGLIAQLYVMESHSNEASSQASSNLEMELSTPAAVARCTDSIINLLGPDLQDMTKNRELILKLVEQYQHEQDSSLVASSLICLEHLAVYAPGHMDFAAYVRNLQDALISRSPTIRNAGIEGLHNIMRRDVRDVLRSADQRLEDDLWAILEANPDHEVVRNIFQNWLHQTGISETEEWVQRCHKIVTRTRARQEKPPTTAGPKQTATVDLQDEEVAGFAAASGNAKDAGDAEPSSGLELLRWQVRAFVMECLSTLVSMIAKDSAMRQESSAELQLQQKIGDVIRIAFSASTAGVVDLRIIGLRIIDQLLKLFGSTPDPDFAEASLLEQYQAQISSALTPAFASDSSPELAAAAVNVCATFIATGIVTDVDRMGRILKLLVAAIESFSEEAETSTIGDLKGLSSNAQVMVRMAVFSAWAELQVASTEQKYLKDVVAPQIGKLTPLWLSSLKEYARLKFQPDPSSISTAMMQPGDLDSIYSALNRETLLRFYQSSWLNLVEAIASLIDEGSDVVFEALDGKADGSMTDGTQRRLSDIDYRNEPVAFFFLLFGVAFEALAARPSDDVVTTKQRNLDILQALKKILRPSVSGHAIYKDVVFSETMDMLDRLVLTEGLDVQAVIVELVRNLSLGHPSARPSNGTSEEENISEDIDQLFELTKIIVLVLAGLIPGLAESNNSRPPAEMSDEAVSLIRLSLDALVDVAEVFPTIIRTDLHACILHIFSKILATGSCQVAVVPQALPIFKRFVGSLALQAQSTTIEQICRTLSTFLTILKNAQKRENEASLACEKNALLASTILLTSTSTIFPASGPFIPALVGKVIECLGNPTTTNVAANCIRSLLSVQPKSAASSAIARRLIPSLLQFVVTSSELEGLDDSRTIVTHTLTASAKFMDSSQIFLFTGLLVPALLSRAKVEGKSGYPETAARLLELASTNQQAFRSLVGSLPEAERGFMEEIIREGGAGSKGREESNRGDGREPTIALKMNFDA
ncbi:HEAT repeat protein-like protein [Viridothelium virens]|uniref:HEAT repeat protein-like protein n=1 Tax=Viridothelium virens TaxID=1048519 RepID=A0A6A6H5I4_VIRVR|nr:HEAT repeat protein-like protein [Viridothelium virens]